MSESDINIIAITVWSGGFATGFAIGYFLHWKWGEIFDGIRSAWNRKADK